MNNIEYHWQETPRLWLAIREGYDGATDSRYPCGLGKTQEEANAALIEAEEAAAELKRVRVYRKRKAALAAKHGHAWTEDEDRKLLTAFDAGCDLQGLAAAHERSTAAVRVRLVKYGRLNA